jgi:hypothetical protein
LLGIVAVVAALGCRAGRNREVWMSDKPRAGESDLLFIREQIARIDRTMEEGHKFTAEQHKLMAEREKFNRDPWILTLAALLWFVAIVAWRLPEIITAFKGVGSP